MDARPLRSTRAPSIFLVLAWCATCLGAGYRTPNFVVVSAPSDEIAREVCRAAEYYRKTLAIDWLGHELPRWSQPCPIRVKVAPNLGAGGVTSFMFEQRRPFGWQMSIQGSYERVLDSVLPHEVTHTIFATHFGCPLPRWADEGACTVVEHESEKRKHNAMLYRFLTSNRGIPFNQMFAMTEYPADIMPLYAQGHSVTEYLVQQRGKRHFVDFVAYGIQQRDWDDAIRRFYEYRDLSDLQVNWVQWLKEGQPDLARSGAALASNTADDSAPRGTSIPGDLPDSRPTASPTGLASWDRATPPADMTHWASASSESPTASKTQSAILPREDGGDRGGSWYARQRNARPAADVPLGPPGVRAVPPIRVATVPQGMPRETTRAPEPQQVSGQVLDWGR